MALSMDKRVEKVGLQLQKFQAPTNLKAQVKFELDDSGSAISMYNSGLMQETTERLMAVAFRLDADQKLEVFSFSSSAHKHGEVSMNDVPNYIQNQFIPEAKKAGTWAGGTDYAKAVALASGGVAEKAKGFIGKLFGSKTLAAVSAVGGYPALHFFLSDGQDMGNHSAFLKTIEDNQNQYYMLIGVGPNSYFDLMKKAADKYSNCGFVNFNDLSISDDLMYEKVLQQELVTWLTAHQP